MIENGTKVMILSGVVNPENIGKVGIVYNVYNDGWEAADGNEVESIVIDVVIEGGDIDNRDDVENLYEIHNDYIEVIPNVN